MKTIYLAIADSRNFSFKAIGNTQKTAHDLLIKGLRLHGKQYNLEPKWWEQCAEMYVQPLVVGEVYRDNSPMFETQAEEV
jgi:hypothetical protein